MDEKGAFLLSADKATSGVRLDIFISESIPELSRSLVANLIKQGHIRVSGQFKKSGYKLKTGDTVTGIIPSKTPSEYLPEPIPITIIHEDPQIIVVDKPPGLVVHPAPGHSHGTLVNALLYLCPDLKGIGGEIRPGIVHRLDKDTSGVMVIAKDDKSHQELSVQFKSRQVVKEYIALTYGEWQGDAGCIELPVGRHPSDRKKMSVHSRKGRFALTEWQVQSRFGGITLVKLNLKTGRTHQIRVHLAAVQHPIVGDPVYASPKMANPFPDPLRSALKGIHRQMLHARYLEIIHPETKKAISFESRIPNDMARIIEILSN